MIAGLYGKSTIHFVRNCETILQNGCIFFVFPQAMNKSSCCFTSLLTFYVISILDFRNSERFFEISSSCSNFQFPKDIRS